MPDITEDLRPIKEALASGPTPGPFAVFNDCVYRASDVEEEYPIVHVCSSQFMEHKGALIAVDAAYIAACSPDRIARLVARLEAAEKSQWRPIETAPKDGTRVLIYMPESSSRRVQEACWAMPYECAPEEQCFWTTPFGPSGRGYTILPKAVTHWMPLPPPPGASPAAPAPVALTEERTFEPISDDEQAALYRHCEGTDHYPVVRRLYRNSCKLPPDLFERERAATICDDLAEMMERGAGECAPGERLRQAARNIREGRPPLSDVGISAPSAEG